MRFRFIVLFLPALFFIFSQIISICGAFEVMSLLDTDDIDDMSLEEIVSVDPFLHSPQKVKTALSVLLTDAPHVSSFVAYVDEVVCKRTYEVRIECPDKRSLSPPINLWLSNRVLRI
jgi:hypothetical protein